MNTDRLTTFVQQTARNPVAWFLYRAAGRIATYLSTVNAQALFAREIITRDELTSRVMKELFPDLTVAGGPFKGMRYPTWQSFGSAILPKLLGSYESELHPVLNTMLNTRYTTVVDIGCGEGYYAVGIALRLPDAQMYAFDTDSRVRQLCEKMAELNGVADRVHIRGLCDQEMLRSLPFAGRTLIISDCEGHEGSLFDSRMAKFLAKCDLLIETHDFIDIELSRKIREAFSGTHDIRSLNSTDDITKAHACDCTELKGYSLYEKRLILAEWRPSIMEWLVMTSKQQSS
jgi:precorrin-6B methylase 2